MKFKKKQIILMIVLLFLIGLNKSVAQDEKIIILNLV